MFDLYVMCQNLTMISTTTITSIDLYTNWSSSITCASLSTCGRYTRLTGEGEGGLRDLLVLRLGSSELILVEGDCIITGGLRGMGTGKRDSFPHGSGIGGPGGGKMGTGIILAWEFIHGSKEELGLLLRSRGCSPNNLRASRVSWDSGEIIPVLLCGRRWYPPRMGVEIRGLFPGRADEIT
jgi:hypothetical protein